jgi:predicted restriction endonuclease
MDKSETEWLAKLGRLNPAISRSRLKGKARFAPHKPLLLLCLIDLAEGNELETPELGKTPGLCLRFDSYWAIVQERWGGRPGLGQPFHYLSNQGFWQALSDDGRPSRSHHSTDRIKLYLDFFACLQDKEFRKAARWQIIRTWFPEPEQNALLSALGISKAEARKEEFKVREESPEYETKGRDARFRVVVVTQYRFTCVLTGYGVHTRRGGSIVEAAHNRDMPKGKRGQAYNLNIAFSGIPVSDGRCNWNISPKCYTRPKTNRAFWDKKRTDNMARDKRVNRQLRRQGWKVIRIWQLPSAVYAALRY